jgi:hypothetical protein
VGLIGGVLFIAPVTAAHASDYTASNLPDWAIGPFTRQPQPNPAPVLSPQAGGFDSSYVLNPGVVYRNGQFDMLYRGEGGSGVQIGLATSPDGLNFTRSPQNPVITNNVLPYESGGVYDPRLYELNGTYYAFIEGYDWSNSPPQTIMETTSTDLVHWTFKKDIMVMSTSNDPTPAEPNATPITPRPKDLPGNGVVLERPKVYYSPTTKKYILYMHLDSGNYGAAGVGTAISDTPDGNFQYLRFFRPLNHESRDIGQFIDDDGSNFLVFEDRPNGFHIAKLSDDCLSVDQDMCLIPMHMEGGALVHYQGLYYAIGSALTGWNPNPNKYATAKSLAGPWSDFHDIAPPETKTYGSQSTMLLKVVGTKATTIIFMGDIWKPRTQFDSRYLWMPLEIGDGQLHLPEPHPWTLNLETGQYTIK